MPEIPWTDHLSARRGQEQQLNVYGKVIVLQDMVGHSSTFVWAGAQHSLSPKIATRVGGIAGIGTTSGAKA
jgi:hypothetical protein